MDNGTKDALTLVGSIVGSFLLMFILIAVFVSCMVFLPEKNAGPIQYLVAACVFFIGYCVLCLPILAYLTAIVGLFIVAIPPALVFKACIEPICGPFACIEGTTVPSFFKAACLPPAVALELWIRFTCWFVGAGSLTADKSSPEAPPEAPREAASGAAPGPPPPYSVPLKKLASSRVAERV